MKKRCPNCMKRVKPVYGFRNSDIAYIKCPECSHFERVSTKYQGEEKYLEDFPLPLDTIKNNLDFVWNWHLDVAKSKKKFSNIFK